MADRLTRRRFTHLLAAGVATALPSRLAAAPSVTAIHLGVNDWCPNNAALPVLLYRGAVAIEGTDPAARFEQLLTQNGWPPQWRNGVYTFHHYHSTAHEVLGFSGGSARLVLGGPGGTALTVHAGDVLLLPTGTGHCELTKTEDFAVVGAYPPGQTWDICRAAPDRQAQDRMRDLPFPHTDPVQGAGGAVAQHWVARAGV